MGSCEGGNASWKEMKELGREAENGDNGEGQSFPARQGLLGTV